MSEYEIMCVCGSGHLYSAHWRDDGNRFCSQCGAELFNECPSCKKLIPGAYRNSMVTMPYNDDDVPSFCGFCGKLFPWTQGRISFIIDAIEVDTALNKEERDKLCGAVPDLVASGEGIRRKKAILTIGRLITKIGKGTFEMIIEHTAKGVTEALLKFRE